MLLYISDHKTVADLQDHFNDCFPYLKLEFYKEPCNDLRGGEKMNRVKSQTFIGTIRRKSNSGALDIKSWYKTSKIKQDIRDLFGLNVQIFRLHKDEWIPTSYSDDLTLKQQIDLAKEYA